MLLLDEPFGALDAKVRQELRQWLRRLHDEIHMTSVFVTHDQEEAFEVADQVVVMNQGRVEQAGTPHEVFEHPANPFVMDFLGNVNVFKAAPKAGRPWSARAWCWITPTPTAMRPEPRPISDRTNWTFSTTAMECPPWRLPCSGSGRRSVIRVHHERFCHGAQR